ncbi:MAG: GNAT family N-acetyltransferase [Bacteroidota bacterium]
MPKFKIIEVKDEIRNKVKGFLETYWGSSKMVTRGNLHHVNKLPGWVVFVENEIKGLISYNIINHDCEIVIIYSQIKNTGIGTKFIDLVIKRAKHEKCKRVWLISTNDNTPAIKFFQKRGFEWVNFYRNAIESSRKLKPGIPLFGKDKISIKHELEFEMILTA